MLVESTRSGDVTILTVGGEVDRIALRRRREAIETALESAGERIVFDLSQASFLDSAAIALLLRARRAAKAKGGGVVLAACSSFLMKVFHTLGLEALFRFTETPEEGVALLVESA